MKSAHIGNITLGKSVTISDPCYISDLVLSNTTIENVNEGEFKCYVKTAIYGSWGKRVHQMLAIHKDYINNVRADQYDFLGFAGVDSGTMSISDSDYYDAHHLNDLDEDWYDKNVCDMYKDDDDDVSTNIADGKCFISESGIGDGYYGVFGAYNKDGYLVAIKVVFLRERRG